MEFNARIIQRLLLFTLAVLIVPLVAFPEQFGTQLARGSLIFVLYEIVYYGVVVFLFNRRGGLIQLVQAAGVCLVYRLALGALFGLLISVMFSMSLKVSLTLGLSSYVPAILFHAALAPFILKPVHDQFYKLTAPPKESPRPQAPTDASLEHGRTSLVVSKSRGFVKDAPSSPPPESTPEVEDMAAEEQPEPAAPSPTGLQGLNGFERAVRYIGEHGSVHLAAVVDHEGLLLANMVRHQVDAEAWAPMALLFFQQNQAVLERTAQSPQLERLNLVLNDKRLSLARYGRCHLMVLSEREAGDVLGIRVHQAMDMIRKYVDERFSDELQPKAETIDVSGTE